MATQGTVSLYQLPASEDEGHLRSRAHFITMMLHCRDKGDRRLPSVTGRQRQSSACFVAQTPHGMMGLTSSPKTFGFFSLVFRVMELKAFLLCSEKGRNNNLCNQHLAEQAPVHDKLTEPIREGGEIIRRHKVNPSSASI